MGNASELVPLLLHCYAEAGEVSGMEGAHRDLHALGLGDTAQSLGTLMTGYERAQMHDAAQAVRTRARTLGIDLGDCIQRAGEHQSSGQDQG